MVEERENAIEEMQCQIRALGNDAHAEGAKRYFKPGKAGGIENDRFLGIRMPVLRQQVKKYQNLSFAQVLVLLRSEYHEERMLALLILVAQFQRGDAVQQREVYELFMAERVHVNNWDLVDGSASPIVGGYLHEREDKHALYQLARSERMWDRRIAVVATHYFIKNGDYADALAIAGILLHDQQDLIHKAVGWTLREVGKRDLAVEKGFLDAHGREMPRTMLRYAIERFPACERAFYMRR